MVTNKRKKGKIEKEKEKETPSQKMEEKYTEREGRKRKGNLKLLGEMKPIGKG